jgi:hypothetical protein
MSDHNLESHYNEDGLRVTGRTIPEGNVNPLAYSDVLKLSLCRHAVVDHCSITGGYEDCIDCVRGFGLIVQDCDLTPKGRNGITIKGGFQTWLVKDTHFTTHGSEADIELGQFSMYDRFPFRNDRVKGGAIVGCTASGNTPVRVRVWNSEVPYVMDGRVEIVKIPWIVWFSYFCFRRIQFIITGK